MLACIQSGCSSKSADVAGEAFEVLSSLTSTHPNVVPVLQPILPQYVRACDTIMTRLMSIVLSRMVCSDEDIAAVMNQCLDESIPDQGKGMLHIHV